MLADRAARLVALRLVRFLLAGGIVFVLGFSLTAGAMALGVTFQLAFIFSYTVAITVHLQLHRLFTFAGDGEYVLGRGGQAWRFVVIVIGQYAFIAASVAVFAPVLGVPDLVVYVGAVVLLSIANYVVLATRVFHSHSAEDPAVEAITSSRTGPQAG